MMLNISCIATWRAPHRGIFNKKTYFCMNLHVLQTCTKSTSPAHNWIRLTFIAFWHETIYNGNQLQIAWLNFHYAEQHSLITTSKSPIKSNFWHLKSFVQKWNFNIFLFPWHSTIQFWSSFIIDDDQLFILSIMGNFIIHKLEKTQPWWLGGRALAS